MWIFRSLLILIIMAIVIGFAFYNTGSMKTVDINLIWTKIYQVPIITVVFWSFIFGALVSWLLFVSIYLKLANRLNKANKINRELETEVAALRNRPIDETKDLLNNKVDRRK